MRRAGLWRPLGLAALAVGMGACTPPSDSAADADADEDWQVVAAYITLDTAWHAAGPGKAGAHPPVELAVAAARNILADVEHPKRPDAAEFLVEHPYGLSPAAEEDIALGISTLAAIVGADWQVVEAHQQATEAWEARAGEVAATTMPDDERTRREKALKAERPPIVRAMAAAVALAEQEGDAKQEAAAEFLIANSRRMADAARFALAGVEVLLAQPEYEGWPPLIAHLYDLPGSKEVDGLFEKLIASGEDAVLRAQSRYYLAARLMRTANDFGIPAEQLAARRERALAVATGLSDGVESASIDRPDEPGPDGSPLTSTLADAEEALLFRINHATAGGALLPATGTRLYAAEGAEQESLAAYAGKVVLIDFWATWCAPCIAALPKLRELRAELPSDAFALLAVSVDAERETVLTFQETEPMPWANWHVGDDSELVRAWGVSAYPTYLLVDGEGGILARTNGFTPRFEKFIRGRVADLAGEGRA